MALPHWYAGLPFLKTSGRTKVDCENTLFGIVFTCVRSSPSRCCHPENSSSGFPIVLQQAPIIVGGSFGSLGKEFPSWTFCSLCGSTRHSGRLASIL
ncbi:unnamed protein product [Somion occarium]|uniref:Uncharacterized protein n=1 Tax=Somion occarium TaxID=3059160 RepID=A0ABP1CEJ0_9APHY